MWAVREPAMAGRFYPADPEELCAAVRHFLAEAELDVDAPETQASLQPSFPKAIIAPHAGYPFSGSIAASAHVRLSPGRDRISRVVLLGTAHRYPVAGLALPACDEFATPLGRVPVDGEARQQLVDDGLATILDEAHRLEHSIEVHVPFLQEVLGEGFALVPLVAGEASADQVQRLCDALWGGDETVFVISSDLSHFLSYEDAQGIDRETSNAIEALAYEDIAPEQACGRVPIQGLLMEARRRGLSAKTVDLRNSGDTSGRRSEVVGYGAYIIA